MIGGKRKKVLVIGALIGIFLLISFFFIKGKMGKEDAGVSVKTVEVVKQDMESHIQTSGQVLSMDSREVMSHGGGKVDEIFVEKGDPVSAGQVLARLESTEIEYAIKEAEIQLAIEEDRLEQMEKGNQFDLETAVKNMKISYEEARDTYEQNKKLFESGAVSKIELDQAKRGLEKIENEYILAKKKLENDMNASGRTIQEKQIALIKLRIEKLKKDMDKYTIKSPMDGIIVDVNTQEGKSVTQGMEIFRIQDINRLEITANISEYDVHKIKIGDAVKITGDAIEGKTYDGQVKYIGPVATSVDTGQGRETVVEIKIGVAEGKTDLKPGFSANVDILTAHKKDVLVVPYEGIFTKKNGQKMIFTVEDGRAAAHEIKTGIEGDLLVEIVGDKITEKDHVILNPTEKLKSGDQVMENKGIENDKNRESK